MYNTINFFPQNELKEQYSNNFCQEIIIVDDGNI